VDNELKEIKKPAIFNYNYGLIKIGVMEFLS